MIDLDRYMAWLEKDCPWYVKTAWRAARVREIAGAHLRSPAFERPLRFADAAQVAELKRWREQVGALLGDDVDGTGGPFRLFEVCYSYSVRESDTVMVEAVDAEEAEELAVEKIGDEKDDVEIDGVHEARAAEAVR